MEFLIMVDIFLKYFSSKRKLIINIYLKSWSLLNTRNFYQQSNIFLEQSAESDKYIYSIK